MAKLTNNSSTFTTNATAKTITGGNGIDNIDASTISAVNGSGWVISGGNGDDIIKGSAFNDVLWGDSLGNSGGISDNGADKMYGGAGNDEIHGGNGADLIQGDAGADVLFGDKGGDTFKYVAVSDSSADGDGAWAGATGDWIKDFTSSQGDKIDLSAVPLTGAAPGTMLTWSATGGSPYDVWVSGGIVYADTDGNGVADIAIKVTGTVGPNDFIGVNHDPNALNDTNAVNEDSSVSGTVATGDTDSDGDTLTYSVVGTAPAGLTFNSNGSYTFDAGDEAYQHLAAGVSEDIITNILVSDGKGGTATQTLTITVTGTNDAPVITSAAQTGEVVEDDTLTATGTVVAGDVDHDAVLTFSGDATGDYGSLVVDADTGAWTYTLDNAAHQNLAEGEEVTETFTVTVTDEYGASDTQDVTITITGTNDAPVAVAATNLVNEDSSVSGNVTSTDVDNGATASYSLDAAVAGLTLNVDGSYTFDASNSAYQSLNSGDTQEVTANYTVTDEHGASSSSTLKITVSGANDAATIGGTTANSVKEDASPNTTSGTLTATDVDNPANTFQAVDAGAATANGYGTYAMSAGGTWTYTLNNANATVNALNNGDTLSDTFTVYSADGTAQLITVTIDGTNDSVTTLPVVNAGDPNNNDGFGLAGDNNVTSTVNGASGNETLYGGSGNDTINAGPGTDVVYGGSGNDQLNGEAGTDTLYGGDGNDVLNGGTQVDVLIGGYGADTLTGGTSSDTFRFLSANDRGDLITDFVAGTDKIDLAGIDANINVVGDQSFTFGGATPTANGVWLAYDSGTNTTHLYADVDGDTSVAEFWLDLSGNFSATGAAPLAASDFNTL